MEEEQQLEERDFEIGSEKLNTQGFPWKRTTILSFFLMKQIL